MNIDGHDKERPNDATERRFGEFLARYWANEDAGRRIPLSEYLREFPDIVERVAREWVQLLKERGIAPAPAEPREDLQHIGSYRLEALLGKGGQGAVYRARHIRLPKVVAVKVLLRGGAAAIDAVKRFEQEAKIGATLSHPAICTVLDAGIADATPYIAMEYVEGETLAQRIERLRAASRQAKQARPDGGAQASSAAKGEQGASTWQMDLEEPPADLAEAQEGKADDASSVDTEVIRWLLTYFEQVARALHFAHEQGVVHRDLKPGNLMITKTGEPKIMDFGLARVEEGEGPSLTNTGDILGTPAYMSPEQLSAKRIRVDRRTDIWSLGVTLYECLGLSRPFEGPSREALYQAINFKDPQPLRRLNRAVGKDLRVVVEKCLEKDRDRRYATALELADELARVLKKEPIVARPVGPLMRMTRWAERHPALAIVLALLFLSISSFSALQWVTNRDLRLSQAAAETNSQRADANARAAAAQEQAAADTAAVEKAVPEGAAAVKAAVAAVAQAETALKTNDERIASLRTKIAGQGSYSFGEDLDLQFRHDNLASLVTELTAFVEAENTSAVRKAAARLERSERIERLTISGPEVAPAWAACILRVYDNDRYVLSEEDYEILDKAGVLNGLYDPATRRLRLTPQLGLIPLGPDPTSGLEEFLHLPSHDYAWDGDEMRLPERRELPAGDRRSAFDLSNADGQTGPIGRDGIILVLIPGGSSLVGGQKTDPEGPNYDPDAHLQESPVHRSTLRPWLFAKYELTQGQWERGASISGDFELRPAVYGLGSFGNQRQVLPRAAGRDHPVENIDHPMAMRWLAQMGLEMPTEVQWERAARGGVAGERWSGASTIEDLKRIANISGEETAKPLPMWQRTPGHRDAYVVHAPVGRFEGNGYGLFDLTGNVWEWVRDGFTRPPEAGRIGDGLRRLPVGADAPTARRVYRGGSFNLVAPNARVSYRIDVTPSIRDSNLGTRPSRSLTP